MIKQEIYIKIKRYSMEYEVRYYYPKKELNNLINKLDKVKGLTKQNRLYEKTIKYDHPNNDMSFYSKEIDGRFRIRISKNEDISKCMISWKRRLNTNNDVNEEEEVELTLKYEEYDNLLFIINNVLKMEQIESYERYRTIYFNDEIEISIDEYPFGIALEIDNKSNNKNPKDIVKKYLTILNLDINNSYKLSWDDKYTSLCKEQNIEIYKDVTFDKPMPEVTK